jgi:multicomponent Na+:H+ antiporter subunit G
MPDTYTKLHSMCKAVFLGVVSLCASSFVTGDPEIIFRAILIAAFLLVTTPISALVIARSAFLQAERVRSSDARDESGRGLARRAE